MRNNRWNFTEALMARVALSKQIGSGPNGKEKTQTFYRHI